MKTELTQKQADIVNELKGGSGAGWYYPSRTIDSLVARGLLAKLGTDNSHPENPLVKVGLTDLA